MRPRGTVGDLRRALREATYRLAGQGGGVTWMQAVQASGLSLGRLELERARLTMRNLVDAGELQRIGQLPDHRIGRPPTLYAPAQASPSAPPAVEAVLRTWCAPTAARRR